MTITKACAVAGLGGKVYRSGDYDYYINETIRNNDPKAVGPFIMASLEYERLQKINSIDEKEYLKGMALFLLLCSGGTLACAQQQKTRHNSRVHETEPGKYRDIQEAVEAVRAFYGLYGDYIYKEWYIQRKTLVIPSWVKNVQLVGEDAEKTIITY